VKNLLKGLIEIESTKVLAAKGGLIWDPQTGHIISYERDVNGNPTGGEVRITPGGITCKDANGVEQDLVLSPAGVLASKVIVNALYALATEDGFTKIIDTGVEVYDNATPQKKRVHLGQYQAGKFGLKLWNKQGTEVVLDEDGILQSWQVTPGAENFDYTKPYTIGLYIPTNVLEIRDVRLTFKMQKFRAYETAVASSLSDTSGSSSRSTTVAGGGATIDWQASGGVDFGWYTDEYSFVRNYTHNHGIANGVRLALEGGGGVTWVENTHGHGVYGHKHFISDHYHDMDHYHSVPGHGHGLSFGIYENASLTGAVGVKVDGIDRTAALGGPFSVNQTDLNLTSFVTAGGHHTVEIFLQNPGLGRVDPFIFVQAKVAA
jgi:hypothetical protein